MNETNPIPHDPGDAAPSAPLAPNLPAARVWRDPAVLVLPDWKGAPASHWLTLWEQHHGLRRVAQHDWQRPLRGDWMMQLQEAVLAHEHCHLLAHGLGAHLIDAWLRHTQQARRVLSVVLIDPIDLQAEEAREMLFTWKPLAAQKWSLPVGLLWKERAPNPALQQWLATCGATVLGEQEQSLGAGPVAGWSLVEAFWQAHDQVTPVAAPVAPTVIPDALPDAEPVLGSPE